MKNEETGDRRQKNFAESANPDVLVKSQFHTLFVIPGLTRNPEST
jgi:hypothetical protein